MIVRFLALAAALAGMLAAEENYRIYAEHPRLFLGTRRQRMLERERERRAPRWLQLETLVGGNAPMPEPGFAAALYYRAAHDQAAGKRAVEWALGAGRDLRQQALVFDWCQEVLSEAQSRALQARLEQGIEQSAGDPHVSSVRSRLLAAVALAGHAPKISERVLDEVVRGWWEGTVVPALKSGRDVLPREEHYALFEILHSVRDNLNLDLRESVPAYFTELPVERLMSYYPAPWPAGENDYRVPASLKAGAEPDLARATLARAADLSLVAFDANAAGSQLLQGWLMHDRFLLRSPLGVPYEFLWANPYQPGLSYYHVPLVLHDETFGRLFVRSSWEEDAAWLGVFDGQAQLFKDGHVTPLDPRVTSGPLALSEAVIYFAPAARRFKAMLDEDEQAFVLGLKPGARYTIEVDDEETREGAADPGGILPLDLPSKTETGVRVRESKE